MAPTPHQTAAMPLEEVVAVQTPAIDQQRHQLQQGTRVHRGLTRLRRRPPVIGEASDPEDDEEHEWAGGVAGRDLTFTAADNDMRDELERQIEEDMQMEEADTPPDVDDMETMNEDMQIVRNIQAARILELSANDERAGLAAHPVDTVGAGALT